MLDVSDLLCPGESRGDGWRRLPSARTLAGVTAGTIDSIATGYTAAKRKRCVGVYDDYEADHDSECEELGRDQHLVNEIIDGHPGMALEAAIELFEDLLDRNYSSEQVQEFIPLPMTRTCIQYVTGQDPLTGEELYVPRGRCERRMQKTLVRWKAQESRKLVLEAPDAGGSQRLAQALRGCSSKSEQLMWRKR
ncbi:MAG: hypothetical protein ACI841_003555 [Planctomycetota bacterium]|jgi:hypothetical protein